MRTFELYEIWSEDANGHQELIETTGDKSQAFRIANEAKTPDVTIIVYQETEDGDLEMIKEL